MPQNAKQPAFPPILVLLIGIFTASTSSIMIRFAQGEASPFVISAARLIIATFILIPIGWKWYKLELIRLQKNEFILLVVSGLFLALHFATWISSLRYTRVSSSVVLVATTPLWVALFSPIFLKERISRLVILGLLITLTGGVIVGIGNDCSLAGVSLVCPEWNEFLGGQSFLGNLLALAGAICAAGYLMVGRKVRSHLSLVTYISIVYGISGLLLFLVSLARGDRLTGFSMTTWLSLLGLGIFPQLIGHSAFNWSLKYLPVAFVSISLLGEPIGSTILAFLLLKEAPTTLGVVGGILIMIGISIASWSKDV
ncbi:MAG TPA: DMT family transporter [Anaerolineaceae bacterium]